MSTSAGHPPGQRDKEALPDVFPLGSRHLRGRKRTSICSVVTVVCTPWSAVFKCVPHFILLTSGLRLVHRGDLLHVQKEVRVFLSPGNDFNSAGKAVTIAFHLRPGGLAEATPSS